MVSRYYRRRSYRRRPAYRRRTRKVYRRRRIYRRRGRVCMRANSSRTVLGFRRPGASGTLTVCDGDGINQNVGAWSFRLDQVTSYTELTNLFDNYKINAVVIKFWWHQQPSTVDQNLIATPIMHWAVDTNDVTPPPNLATLKQYSSYRVHQFKDAGLYTIKLYPKPQVATYRTALTTAYGPKKMWIASTYSDTPHYGFKFWIDGSQTAAGGAGTQDIGGLTYEITYYVSVKNSN